MGDSQPVDDHAKDLQAQLDLALRFLSGPATDAPMELKPGELALGLPIPEGGRAIGTLLSDATPTRMLLESPQDAAAALEDYDRQLRAQGWTSQYLGRHGGFLPSPPSFIPSHYVAPSQDIALMVMLAERQPGSGATISVTVLDPPDPASVEAQRDFNMRRHEALQSAMPPLWSPRGASVVVEGSSGSDHSWRVYARMTTTLELAAIAAHYDQQLAESGLPKLDGGSGGAAAWSLWSAPIDSEAMTLVFFVVRLPGSDGEYLLEARIEGRESQGTHGRWTTYSGVRSATHARPRPNP